jgi:L-aspartate oxidase
MKTRGEDNVYLDITGRLADEVRERFPSIYKRCLESHVNITKDWIPVVPAAHYMCGGVIADLHGRTTLRGLYAAGEVACSGVHGANRLASNSLLEAVVFSTRAAMQAIKDIEDFPEPDEMDFPLNSMGKYKEEEMVLISHDLFQIKKLMWDYVGIVRNTLRLERAKRRVELILREVKDLVREYQLNHSLVELRNVALVADLIIRSALRRKESRGLHYTTDYPDLDNSRKPRNTYIINQRKR